MRIQKAQLGILAIVLAGAMTANASVTLNYLGYGPNETVNVKVYTDNSHTTLMESVDNVVAGFYNININGGPTIKSFCIDVADNSTPSTTASIVALANAPDSWAGPMGATAASTIKQLWHDHYSPGLSAADAAAMQIAIWTAIDQAMPYSIVFSGNDTAVTTANTWLANLGGIEASLNAVSSSQYQDFIVPVPEPTTMIAGALLLLPFGASTLRILRRKA